MTWNGIIFMNDLVINQQETRWITMVISPCNKDISYLVREQVHREIGNLYISASDIISGHRSYE
jgi:hypothetical protein